eukprot:scaffold610572_cov47-Prasinocladus_malaysianus.AAC.1
MDQALITTHISTLFPKDGEPSVAKIGELKLRYGGYYGSQTSKVEEFKAQVDRMLEQRAWQVVPCRLFTAKDLPDRAQADASKPPVLHTHNIQWQSCRLQTMSLGTYQTSTLVQHLDN